MLLLGLADIEPRLPNTMMTFILISIMLSLYLYFGFDFISKSRKSKNPAQKSYYKGLGIFIVSVAISESIYLIDYIYRVLYGRRIFHTIADYETLLGIHIHTLFTGDYFVLIFMLLAFGLIFLASPLEKYLLGRKRKPLTFTSGLVIPLPLIARFLELNLYNWTRIEVIQGTRNYIITSLLWLVNVGVIFIAILILFSLYLKMGAAAPEGSKLRKKSKQIVFGLIFWIFGILLTSRILKAIWDNGLDWLNLIQTMPEIGRLYYILPLVIPGLLLISLSLLISGFKKEY